MNREELEAREARGIPLRRFPKIAEVANAAVIMGRRAIPAQSQGMSRT
jgi:hypothetical protein